MGLLDSHAPSMAYVIAKRSYAAIVAMDVISEAFVKATDCLVGIGATVTFVICLSKGIRIKIKN